jgi:hypothetical protein
VGIETINLLETKEFCDAPRPSKVLKGKERNSHQCPLIAPKKSPVKLVQSRLSKARYYNFVAESFSPYA